MLALDERFVRGLLERYLAAWNRRDPEAVLAEVTEDVSWTDPTIAGGRAHGHAAVRACSRRSSSRRMASSRGHSPPR
jgi:ketosteroid isomerase-like protein